MRDILFVGTRDLIMHSTNQGRYVTAATKRIHVSIRNTNGDCNLDNSCGKDIMRLKLENVNIMLPDRFDRALLSENKLEKI